MAIQPKNDTAIKVDTITEKTTNNGVDIETVHLEDQAISNVTTLDMSGALTTDTINEKSASNGVDVEGVKLVDSYAQFSSVSPPGTPSTNEVRLYDASGELIAKDDQGDTWSLTPAWQTWAPTYGATGSMTYSSVTTNLARYIQFGKWVCIQLAAEGTTGGTASTGVTFTLPVTAASSMVSYGRMAAHYRNAGSGNDDLALGFFNTASVFLVGTYPYGSNWTLGAGRRIRVFGCYEAA